MLSFSIWFHTIVLFLLRPFIGQGALFCTFTAHGRSPHHIYNASIRQLKRMVILYQLNHPEAQLTT